MTSPTRNVVQNQLILVGLVTFVAVGLTLAFNLGVGYAGDEQSHLHVVEHHSRSISPSPWDEWAYGSDRGHAYHLFSPVPYIAYLPFERIQEKTQVGRSRVTRLGGVVYAAAQVLVTWLISVQLLGRTTAALLLTFAVNLIPQLRYLHGYVNADSFTILMGTWAIYLAFKVWDQARIAPALVCAVGLAVAGLAHSKPTAYPIAGLLLAVFCVKLLKSSHDLRQILRRLGVVMCLTIVLAGPFHLHVYNELGTGEVMATATHLELRGSSSSGLPRNPEPSFDLPDAFIPEEMPLLWLSLWGWLPQHAELPKWHLKVLAALTLVGLIGGLVGLRNSTLLDRRKRFLLALAPLAFALTYAILLFQPDLRIQGRLLLPAGVGFLFFLVLGLAEWLTRIPRVTREGAVIGASSLWILILGVGNMLLLMDL